MQQEKAKPSAPTQDPMVWFSVAVVLSTVIFFFFPLLKTGTRADYLNVWADMPLIALATFALAYRRPVATSERERGFWMAWAAGFGCWFLGRLIWGLFQDAGLPINLTADFFFALLYVGLLIGLELDPSGPPPSEFQKRLRLYTTGGGILLLLTTFAYFTLIPALIRPVTYNSWIPAVLGTVILDVYVLIRLYGRYKSSRTGYWKQVYRWLLAAFALWAVTDTLDVVAVFGTIGLLEDGTPLDLVWYVPCMLLVVGVLVGRRPHDRAPVAHTRPVTMAGPMGSTPLLIYVVVLPLSHVVLNQTGLTDPDLRATREILLTVTSLLFAAIIYRTHQMILQENQLLRRGYEDISQSLKTSNQDLEFRVHQRTEELEVANRLLADDVEQRAKVERQLRSAEARNSALILAVPDALILVNYDGVVQDVFSGRVDLKQVALSSGKGRVLSQLLPPNFQTDIEEALGLIRSCTVEEFGPVPIENASGTQQFEFRFSQCGENEILVVAQDVTERRAFELSLQRSQKLESLSVMAGGIAHEFNNMLASILGNAQLAREILTDENEVTSSLVVIEGSARRASKLTDNLLAYAGEAHIEREPLDLVAVIWDMKSLLATAIPKPAQLKFELGSEPLWIVGNEAQLTQILLNLAHNAAEALTDGNGSVLIDTSRIQISETGLENRVLGDNPMPGDYVRLRVRDTGCGMTTESQQRIFDPFFTSKGTGRGLGLAATLGIIGHHDGALTLESTLGEGSELSVYFPAYADHVSQETGDTDDQRLQSKGTILVVDDEKEVRDLTATFLERRGFVVVQASDGAEAVEQAHTHLDHLTAIIMDYSMPKLNGVEAFHQIRRENRNVPVILMSGYGQREDLQTLIGEHLTGFIKKPFELKELAMMLQQQFGLVTQKSQA